MHAATAMRGVAILPRMRHPSFGVILVLWAAITALGHGKAFHIDDTFHLKAGQWIEAYPLQPMSGLVNWAHDPEPIHRFNQPPGFFYAVALTGHWFGYGEAPMHAMLSLFTLLALICFHRLARHRSPRSALLLTALFALCPAFLVNQGVMADVPLLALLLLTACLLLLPGPGPVALRLSLAALVLCGALSVKYAALPMLVVFAAALVIRRQWRWLWLPLVPVLFLALWSAWNLHEYGGMHLLDRVGGDPSPRGIFVRTLSLLTVLGAVAPFTPLFAKLLLRSAGAWLFRAWAAACVLALLFAMGVFSGRIPQHTADQVLRITFTLNGALIVAYCAAALPRKPALGTGDTWILAAWALGMASFIALFSPTMATRHVLLVLPPVLLLAAPAVNTMPKRVKTLAVACTAGLGLCLALADHAYAGFYRQQAPLIAKAMRQKTTGTVWSAGHWGWQWYAEQAGMPTYGRTTSAVQAGDVLVVAQEHSTQAPATDLVLQPISRWTAPASLATCFGVDRFAGLYDSSYGKLPWSLGHNHRSTIVAYRVVSLRQTPPTTPRFHQPGPITTFAP